MDGGWDERCERLLHLPCTRTAPILPSCSILMMLFPEWFLILDSPHWSQLLVFLMRCQSPFSPLFDLWFCIWEASCVYVESWWMARMAVYIRFTFLSMVLDTRQWFKCLSHGSDMGSWIWLCMRLWQRGATGWEDLIETKSNLYVSICSFHSDSLAYSCNDDGKIYEFLSCIIMIIIIYYWKVTQWSERMS